MTTPTTLKPATFAPEMTFAVGDYPTSVGVADVNGDGNADVVTANAWSDNVSVLVGDGRGNFAAQKTFMVGSNPTSVSVADVNGDGNSDVVTANLDGNNISVLLGNGKGGFAAQKTFMVGSNPTSVSVADVNGDGNSDVVTANSDGNNVSVLLGNGKEGFAAQKTFMVGSFPYSVSVADVNGDGNADVVTANSDSNDVSLLMGDGLGNFAEQIKFDAGLLSTSVNVVDVNGDGNMDIVTVNNVSSDLSVLVGDGQGNFAEQTNFDVEPYPLSLSVADVNGDGSTDIITTYSFNLGDGRGNFATLTNFDFDEDPDSVIAVDVNGDKKPDLITTNWSDNTVSILLNTTEGTFVAPSKPDVKPVAVQHSPTGKIQINGNVIQNETLSIQNTLKDEDGLGTFSYQWLQNSKAISGATQSTYTLSANDIGTAISVKVSYTDGLKKLETVTSDATVLIEPKIEEILPPSYALTVDKTSVNEGDTVTFKLATTNVDENTEIPFNFGGTISNADVLGGLKTNSFVVDSNGKASLAVKFIADKLTEGAENLTLTLNSGESQSVTVKDTSVTPASIVKPVPVIEQPVTVKPISENTSTSSVKVDGLTLTAKSNAKDLLIGGEKNDFLKGLAGADTLRGNAGHDFLDGGLGNDSLDGGNGNDTLIGGEGNDKLIAGSGDDKLDAGKGDDTLDSGAGKDTLIGGAGVDSMTGGDGDDFYVVDNVKDKVIETNTNVTTGGKDTVTSNSPTYTLGENIENLILEDLQGKGTSGTGNKGNNVITGSIGDNKLEGLAGNDTLISGDGADTLDGGLGMDSLVGGNGDDLYIMNNIDDLIEEKPDGGIDHIVAAVTFNLGQSENVEWLTLSGAKAIEGTGNDSNNLLQEIAGGKTNNTFTGNGGNDTLNGEDGDDTLDGGDGDDELNGGDGQDMAIFTGDYSDYLITINTDADGVAQLIVEYKNSETGILDGTDTLNDIEILEFADGDRHNLKDVLKDISSTETDSSAMVILTGTEIL